MSYLTRHSYDRQKTRLALALRRPPCHSCFTKQTNPFKFKQSKQEVQVTTFWSILIEVVSNTTAGKGVKVRTRQIEAKV